MSLYELLRGLSFTNSAVFAALLYVAFAADGPEPETAVLGWTHGVMWITLSVLAVTAVRRRAIPFWLGVLIAVVGGVGPFAGSIGLVVDGRRRSRSTNPPTRL